MHKDKEVDLAYRPPSYTDLPTVLLANIKGNRRKASVLKSVSRGDTDSVPSWAFAESLEPERLEFISRINPADAAGEQLPDCTGNQVEIVRVIRQSDEPITVSFRATIRSGNIRYEAVDEEQSDYVVNPKSSTATLSQKELIRLIDTTIRVGTPRCKGRFVQSLLEADFQGDEASVLQSEVRVTSDFYPELEQWYRYRIRDWGTNMAKQSRLARRDRHRRQPEVECENGFLPLHWAAFENDVELAVELIAAGADVNVRHLKNDVTPLHVASFWGNVEVMEALLDRGADIDAKDEYGSTPLLKANGRLRETVNLLLSRGASVTETQETGSSPLHRFARLGDTKIVQDLIDLGADVHAREYGGCTPLRFATSSAMLEVFLKAGADPNARSSNGYSPIHPLVALEHAAISISNVDPRPGGQDNFVIYSKPWGEDDAVKALKILAGYGGDMNARDWTGCTPLHVTNSGRIVRTLIELGADTELTNRIGQKPLQSAACGNKASVAKALIEGGAKLNAADEFGHMPLHMAATEGGFEVLQVLIDAGADLQALDIEGDDSRKCAADMGRWEFANYLARFATVGGKSIETLNSPYADKESLDA